MPSSEVLRSIAILTSAVHVGSQFSLSYVSGAALLTYPTPSESSLLAQFRVIFRRGFYLCPPSAGISTLANLINAFLTYGDDGRAALFSLLAAVISASLIPFTLAFIVGAEEELLQRANRSTDEGDKKTPAGHEESTRDLIIKWSRLNYYRPLFPLLGVLLAYFAI